MLSKKACMRCAYGGGYKFFYHPWGDRNEYLWDKKGIVFCAKADGFNMNVNDEPPEQCPYFLEHLLGEQQDAK